MSVFYSEDGSAPSSIVGELFKEDERGETGCQTGRYVSSIGRVRSPPVESSSCLWCSSFYWRIL